MSLRDAGRLLRGLGSSGAVTLTTCGQIATVRLQNPEKRNAVTPSMMIQYSEAVQKLERACADGGDETTVVVLRGEGRFFCSGADLSAASKHLGTKEAGAAMCLFMSHWTTRFAQLPLISVAAIEGGAVGGGTELASACDHRVMASDAVWKMVHVTHGLSPGWGGGV